MWLETIHTPEDHEEKCLSCGGGVHKRVFGEMHAGSFVLDGERVEIRGVPASGFANPIVLDEITQYFCGALYRIWPSDKYFSKGGSRLHRDVWKAAFGEIPRRCHVHHRDGDKANNRIENLEAIDSAEHLRIERGADSVHKQSRISDATRLKAAEWHGSDAGREWHRRQAVRAQAWTKWQRETKKCLDCGTEFLALVRKSGNSQVYCCSACKVSAYRKRGKQNEYSAAYRAREADKRKG